MKKFSEKKNFPKKIFRKKKISENFVPKSKKRVYLPQKVQKCQKFSAPQCVTFFQNPKISEISSFSKISKIFVRRSAELFRTRFCRNSTKMEKKSLKTKNLLKISLFFYRCSHRRCVFYWCIFRVFFKNPKNAFFQGA